MKNSFPKILITGGYGQVASSLIHKAATIQPGFHLIPCTSKELNIIDPISIAHAISTHLPDIIINAAAATAVDKAEQEKEHAMQVNFMGTKLLALACSKNNIPLIHFSTDYIFDGEKKSPYKEEDPANPINLYGKSKWMGEEEIRKLCGDHLILRVSGVFSEFGHNFLKTILRLAKEREELRVIDDQTTCPTYAGDIVTALFSLVNQHSKGTYHFCSNTPVTWYQFACAIIEEARGQFDLKVKEIIPIPSSEYQTAAKRPAYSVLDCSKYSKETGLALPCWRTGIQQVLKGISP